MKQVVIFLHRPAFEKHVHELEVSHRGRIKRYAHVTAWSSNCSFGHDEMNHLAHLA